MNKVIEKLKRRWNVNSVWQVVLILFIFSITGMTTLYVKEIFYDLMGFGVETPFWEKAAIWVLVVLPAYQILFLGYGFIFGQFEFVWRFEKKNLGRIKKLLPFVSKESV